MKALLIAAIVCASTLTATESMAQWSKPASETVVIRGGWLFDGIADLRVRNTGIVIRDGKFAEVGADLKGREFDSARVITLDDGATILPGMFDLHAHYNMDLVDEGRAEEVHYNAISVPRQRCNRDLVRR